MEKLIHRNEPNRPHISSDTKLSKNTETFALQLALNQSVYYFTYVSDLASVTTSFLTGSLQIVAFRFRLTTEKSVSKGSESALQAIILKNFSQPCFFTIFGHTAQQGI
ncbi:MAG: hypothetical protein ACI9IV_001122 [Paracoccaceae bacterium]|jgi:hypothetical protein